LAARKLRKSLRYNALRSTLRFGSFVGYGTESESVGFRTAADGLRSTADGKYASQLLKGCCASYDKGLAPHASCR